MNSLKNFDLSKLTEDNTSLFKKIKDFEIMYNQLDAIIESSFDGIYITDGNATTLRINKAYERITNMKKEDLIGKNMRTIVNKGIISESGTLLAVAQKKGVTIQQTFNNGKTVLVSSNPVFDVDGNISMVVTNVRDITELIELNNKLEKNVEISKSYQSKFDFIKDQLLNHFKIVTNNKNVLNLIKKAKKIAPMDVTVLLLGETGVGKGLLAKYIYENSDRHDKCFFKVNCGAIPIHLMESQLFGYEKGAFTGANKKGKIGIFEAAQGGTLLLDEIGELPLDLQVKFLNVLQEGEITRVGGIEPIEVDVRILAATNKNLEEMVEKKLFREDLYYRLNVVPLTIPPLRERVDDIPLLINEFLKELNLKYGFNKSIDSEVIDVLCEYDWPGNIRELKNIIERIILMSNSDVIGVKDLPVEFEMNMHRPKLENMEYGINLNSIIQEYEMNLINWAYSRHKNVRDSAKFLGLHPSTFVRKRQRGNKT